MSNWLTSIFKSDDDDDDPQTSTSSPPPRNHASPSAGVKSDLSVLGGAISARLRSAASFLAPPPPPESAAPESSLVGVRDDLAEIGGGFKWSLSRLASNLLQQLDEDGGGGGFDDDVAGVTEEVVEYVRGVVSSRPRCWIDFPLSPDRDFVMSAAQEEHASAIESLVPDLMVWKHKMCSYMSEEIFWMIYFALLPPILNEHDKKLLITPQIDQARAVFQHKQMNNFIQEDPTSLSQEADSACNQPGGSSLSPENEVFGNPINVNEGLETFKYGSRKQKLVDEHCKHEEDILFSDLENDDSELSERFRRHQLSKSERVSSYSESSEWVRLTESLHTEGGELKAVSGFQEKDSEGEDSHGWLTVDEFDF